MFEQFKELSEADIVPLGKYLASAEADTCEYNLLNLYAWAHVYHTLLAFDHGWAWLYFTREDELLFPWRNLETGEYPSPEILHELSESFRKQGKSGIIHTVPPDYAESFPGYSAYFDFVPMHEDFDEYVYSVQKLVDLPGNKLGKKRNLISQFIRLYPDFKAVPLTEKELSDCIALSGEWDSAKLLSEPDPSGIRDEIDAMDRMFRHFRSFDLCGCCIYAGGRLRAFSVNSKISKDTYTEHYEKTEPGIKGAGQIVNRENARLLLGKCAYLNREQDLGLEGLRHAKQSYAPCRMIRNFKLVPKG